MWHTFATLGWKSSSFLTRQRESDTILLSRTFTRAKGDGQEMKTLCMTIVLALPLCAAPAHAQNVEGDWQGTLQVYSVNFRLNLHVSQDDKGGLAATLDSPDMGARGIEASSVKLKKSSFKFEIPAYNGLFEGRVSTDESTIVGTWYQGEVTVPITFKRRGDPPAANNRPAPATATAANPTPPQNPPAAAPAQAAVPVTTSSSGIEGIWLGALQGGGGIKIRLQLHVERDAAGTLTVKMDSLDQGANGISTSNVFLHDSTFHFEIQGGGITYEGTLNAPKDEISGTFSQHGAAQPLTFKHSAQPAAEPHRPQDPVKPYPYLEEDVFYANPKAPEVKLAATLALPRGAGPFPVAVLICGSGAHDRDESLLGHRPFLVISDYLTRHGIAVLRYDKRGVAKSTGNYALATSEDFASDAETGIAYLKTRKEIDPRHIGLIGHSEGGLIAPLIASRNKDVAWIVLLAGPGLRGDEILFLQEALIAKAGGATDEVISKSHAMNSKLFAVVEDEKNPANLKTDLEAAMDADELGRMMSAPQKAEAVQQLSSPWMREFLTYDPVPALEKTKCPVLALNGEHDLQVPPEQDLAAIKKALQAGSNKDFQTTEMPGLNHLFQHSATGSPSDYQKIDETFSPEALDVMTVWIQKHSS
jgi:pimeloyl-ACP methyl ester carboxylesterase